MTNPSGRTAEIEMVTMSTSCELFCEEEKADDRSSNESLLSIAFISFMAFTMCQTVASFIAGSEAMMGDSAAMFVDALTYLFNWIAERRKSKFDETWEEQGLPTGDNDDPERAQRLRERAKRKMILQLEFYPPLISVATLIVVTIAVSQKAIRVLILDEHRSRSEQSNPNINLMLIFSTGNLGLDIVNVFCFAKAKHALGYATSAEPLAAPGNSKYKGVETCEVVFDEDDYDTNGDQLVHQKRTNIDDADGFQDETSLAVQKGITDQSSKDSAPEVNGKDTQIKFGRISGNGNSENISTTEDVPLYENFDEDNGHEKANLNMCSAYTHVIADTLRSIAVVIAAVIAKVVDDVTPEEADATAAVVVSALILLSLISLIYGLLQTISEIRAIRAEGASEMMLHDEDIKGAIQLA